MNSGRYHYRIEHYTGNTLHHCVLIAEDRPSVCALLETLRDYAKLRDSALQVHLQVNDKPEDLGIEQDELVRR